MECQKCHYQSEEDSIFCSQCGTKLEEQSTVDNLIQNCQRLWYLIGFLRGRSIEDKDKQWYADYEKRLKKNMPELYIEYEEMIQFWKDYFNKDEQDKPDKQRNEQSSASAGNN